METPKRIFDFYYYQDEEYSQTVCLSAKEDGKWKDYSTESVIEKATNLSRSLLASGIKKGDTIAMISNNRPEWHILDLAILQIGAINVPIYPTVTAEEYAYVLNHAECKMIFVSDQTLFDKVNEIKNRVPSLKEIYSFDKIKGAEHYSTLLKRTDKKSKDEVIKIMDSIDEKDLATLIYTSGTTGKPKGVMLSHYNIVNNVLGCKSRLPVDEYSCSLSFLPLCHVYERTVCYLYIYSGVSIHYAESIDTIGVDLKEVKPEVFTAVPRVLEKVYEKIMDTGRNLKGIKKLIFFWTIKLGSKYKPNNENSRWYDFKLKIARKLVFKQWKAGVGGNALAVASGSAPLQPRLARIFLAAGIPIMEGYGLTETSPVVAVNSENNNGVMIGTVGRVLEGIEVKIADDGEILVKGHCVMMGYYKDEEKTKETIDKDGWLHTGDIGELVNGEFLKITDRKKQIFKTSGGKYIAPQVLENKFKESNFIGEMVVLGSSEKMPAAFILPEFKYLKKWCEIKNISFSTREKMVKNPQIIARFKEEVDQMNKHFAHYEQIKVFELISDEWSIETGELTPTLKVKRKFVLEKYKDLYNQIYHKETY